MTYDELLAKIEKSEADMCSLTVMDDDKCEPIHEIYKAIRAVVELHKPIPSFTRFICAICMQRSDDDYEVYDSDYPCSTIRAIEKEMG